MLNENVLRRIRQAVREKRYRLSDHALEEADADDLTLDDILGVLLQGDLVATYTEDPRGVRYVVSDAVRNEDVEVVCRLRADDSLLVIITVYVVTER
ncbi:MAG: hypothetical protein OHK0023_24340 [Anaerolineae bacterium]